MAERTHELILAGDSQTGDRLGFRYTEGCDLVRMLHPDSQYSEHSVDLDDQVVEALRAYFTEVQNHMKTARTKAREAKGATR